MALLFLALIVGVALTLRLHNLNRPGAGAPDSSEHQTGTYPPQHQAATLQGSPSTIGDIVSVARGTQSNGKEGFWPCGSSPQAFDELMKWAVRGDNEEMKRTMRATHSIGLTSNLRVKVLDTGFGKRRVRVVSDREGNVYLKDEKGQFLADPRIGRECWVVTEALTR